MIIEGIAPVLKNGVLHVEVNDGSAKAPHSLSTGMNLVFQDELL